MTKATGTAIENGRTAGGKPASVTGALSSSNQTVIPPHPFIIATIATSQNAGNSTVAVSVARGLTCNGAHARVVRIGDSLASGHIFKISDRQFLSGLVRPTGTALYASHPQRRKNAALSGSPDQAGNFHNPAALVIEISKGLLHDETMALLSLRCFRTLVAGVVLASGDTYGAAAAINKLKRLGLSVLCVSGVITSSPMALREARRALTIPVLKLETVRTGCWLPSRQLPAAAIEAGNPAETGLIPACG